MVLHNTVSKTEAKALLKNETFKRITLSFYRYIKIHDTEQYRNDLYTKLKSLEVFGRIYVSQEGINAQISIPESYFEAFKTAIDQDNFLKGVPFKIAVEDDGKSFFKLIVRLRDKIVADGLPEDAFDFTDVGHHMTAREMNDAMNDPKTVVIDMRNHYESEVGRFENAICPDADTFRDALPKALEMVEDKKDHKVILYCTGGIRCEKASAYFKHHGFKDVNQLVGGIIDYARQVKAEGLESKFKGKNFVFDDRMGERITEDILSVCHQCGQPCDTHVNCANDDCHLLFIQCDSCKEKFLGCCTPECMNIVQLPLEEQRKMRKGKIKTNAHAVYKSRLRPNLRELISKDYIKLYQHKD